VTLLRRLHTANDPLASPARVLDDELDRLHSNEATIAVRPCPPVTLLEDHAGSKPGITQRRKSSRHDCRHVYVFGHVPR
jgi:hypothetical protein